MDIIKIQHTGLTFKGKTYSNRQQLHYNMAKYYVKAFQVYYAINKIKKLTIVPELQEVKEFNLPYLLEPLSDLHIAYNYIFHLKQMHESYIKLDKILENLMKDT